jgi:hypothetical protein
MIMQRMLQLILPSHWFVLCCAFGMSTMTGLAQYKCNTVASADGKRHTCYHVNKQPSTTEFWDKENLWGRFEAWNNKGEPLVSFELRKVAGHAGVDVSYHANGQVSRLEYSSAPDGGIQFWNYIYTYNEEGQETSRVDLSRPDGHPHVTVPEHLWMHEEEPQNPVVVLPVKPEPPKDVRVSVEIVVMNITGKRITGIYRAADDSTARTLRFSHLEGNRFSDTLLIDPAALDRDLCNIQIIGRHAKTFRVEQILSGGNTRIYAFTRRTRV